MNRLARGPVLVIVAILLLPTAAAHAPIGGGSGERLETATRIPDPTKSWAIYAGLQEGGEAHYYVFDIAQGVRIHVSLMTTTAAEDADFMPGVILMGPGLESRGFLPSYLEAPEGAGIVAVNGTRSAPATYEPFAPSSFVELADLSLAAPASGTYYVAVHAPDRGGHYSLAIGDRESFTILEWLLIPFSLLSAHTWGRQSLPVVLLPAAATAAFGLLFLVRRHRAQKRTDLIGWTGGVAGLLFLGTGATVVSQMALSINRSSLDASAIVTFILAAVPIILGLGTLRLVLRHSGAWDVQSRIYLVLMGGGALVAWAGFVIGPVLAIAAAVLPSRSVLIAKRKVEA